MKINIGVKSLLRFYIGALILYAGMVIFFHVKDIEAKELTDWIGIGLLIVLITVLVKVLLQLRTIDRRSHLVEQERIEIVGKTIAEFFNLFQAAIREEFHGMSKNDVNNIILRLYTKAQEFQEQETERLKQELEQKNKTQHDESRKS